MMSHQREYDIGIHKQQSALEALQNEIAARQAKLEALQGGISSLENLTRTQTERIVWLQQELRTIHGSKTWKVLCLLRKLKNRVLPPESTSAVIGKRAVNKVLSSAHTVTRKMRQNRDIALINKSGLFDREWYLTTYPDIANSQVDPLTHYLFFGAFEGRDPGPDFSSSYYFRSNVDVRVVETNPLMHYLKFGKNEGRRPKPGAGDMPVNHTAVMTEPSPAVEVNSLANTQGQVKAQNQADTGLPGLEIYASQTTNLTGRMTQPNEKSGIVSAPSDQTQRVELLKSSFEKMLETASGIRMDDYVPYRENEAINAQDTVKLITFYLPQFHPIPENDLWWGKGFTEWTNVSKAVPQFYGHYQPRLPGELGFYDLRLPEVQARQVELARNYGIHGFCFYHYWFGGKRLLDKPLDMFVNNPNIDFPFCICWANENWTRRWDGKEDDVLMQQQHSLDNDIYFIHELLPYLENERYIRIDGRPLIIVYRTSLLKNASATAKAWRKFCLEKGLGDPYLVAAQTFGFNDPQPIGFDAAVEFPPHNIVYTNIIDRVHLLNNNYQGAVYSYIEMVSKNIEPLVDHPYRVFRTACPSWDNEPRKPGRGNSFIGSNPELYSHWVKKLAFAEMASHDENSRFVFVNSWNEWGEGANLEPDRKFGYAYLQATHDALANCSPPDLFNINGKINLSSLRMNYETAVLLHVFYPDLLEEMKSYLDHIGDYDLYISIPESEEELDKEIFKVFPDAFVFRVLNRGRDIAPFISMLDLINLLGYPYFLKLHTKKSQHRADGDFWRRDILQKLTGSPECVNLIKQTLKRNKNIGIVGPKGHVLSSQVYWGFNKNKTIELASRVGLALDENPTFEFVAGTMFWAKPQAFNLFSMLPICLDEFEPEPIAKDGALVHSLERFIGISAQETGCRIWEIGEDGVITDPRLNLDRFFPFAVQT